jgi:hypothetical protein
MKIYAIVAKDQWGHDPQRYDISAESGAAAIREARDRYGHEHGVDYDDTRARNHGIVPGVCWGDDDDRRRL